MQGLSDDYKLALRSASFLPLPSTGDEQLHKSSSSKDIDEKAGMQAVINTPESEYAEVEKIMTSRITQEEIEYKVRWSGCDAQDDTWIAARELRETAGEAIRDFERERIRILHTENQSMDWSKKEDIFILCSFLCDMKLRPGSMRVVKGQWNIYIERGLKEHVWSEQHSNWSTANLRKQIQKRKTELLKKITR